MGEGGGLGTDGRGRSGAAGPSSSVGAHCPWVGGCCWPCVLVASQLGVVLSMGIHHGVGGMLSMGGVSSFMVGGSQFWVLGGHSVCGQWS